MPAVIGEDSTDEQDAKRSTLGRNRSQDARARRDVAQAAANATAAIVSPVWTDRWENIEHGGSVDSSEEDMH
jgi:hypothetical protein